MGWPDAVRRVGELEVRRNEFQKCIHLQRKFRHNLYRNAIERQNRSLSRRKPSMVQYCNDLDQKKSLWMPNHDLQDSGFCAQKHLKMYRKKYHTQRVVSDECSHKAIFSVSMTLNR